jgi:hypothetical protein
MTFSIEKPLPDVHWRNSDLDVRSALKVSAKGLSEHARGGDLPARRERE